MHASQHEIHTYTHTHTCRQRVRGLSTLAGIAGSHTEMGWLLRPSLYCLEDDFNKGWLPIYWGDPLGWLTIYLPLSLCLGPFFLFYPPPFSVSQSSSLLTLCYSFTVMLIVLAFYQAVSTFSTGGKLPFMDSVVSSLWMCMKRGPKTDCTWVCIHKMHYLFQSCIHFFFPWYAGGHKGGGSSSGRYISSEGV